MISAFKNLLHKFLSRNSELNPAKAYDIWSYSYDMQPGNLMLDLDEKIFSEMLRNINLENKVLADIGCGTGRHWQKIYEKKPALVMGFDVSSGMLKQLRRKFPEALTEQTKDNLLRPVPDKSVDCLIATLTIAHIRDIEQAIKSWSRILKDCGDLILTDFHPATLAKGGKRSFKHEGKSLWVINYVHSLEKIKDIFNKYGFLVIREEEKCILEEVKPYYAAQNALPVYEQFKGMPIIYGIHLKKGSVTE
jgi:ubiquinone/menaquinone biosynthesis C-methylase UbiE